MANSIAGDHHGGLSHGLVLSTSHLHRNVLQSDGTNSFFGEAEAEAVSDGAGVTLLILVVIVSTGSSRTVRTILTVDVVRTFATGNSRLVAQTCVGLVSSVAVNTEVVRGNQTETSNANNAVTSKRTVTTISAVVISVDCTIALEDVVVSTRARNALF